jgi:hypothetical protein
MLHHRFVVRPKVMFNALQETRMLVDGLLSAAHALSINWELNPSSKSTSYNGTIFSFLTS